MSATDQATITRDGIQWIFTAGIFAVILVAFLWYVDDSLTYNPATAEHDQALHDLRSAQAGLNSSPSDSRMYEAARP